MPRSLGQALLLWTAFAFVFLLFGGIGAGVTGLLYEAVSGNEMTDTAYAVYFAALGLIAYRVAERYVQQRGA
jgi:hypothetical protein